MSPPRRGALIVVEGLDRAGKTTQVARLVKRLHDETGVTVEGIKFPDRTTAIGRNLNAYLTSTSTDSALPLPAAHLLFSANRWEAVEGLLAKLRAGTSLIVDRYSFSGAVYTTAKSSLSTNNMLSGRHHSLDWTWSSEIGLPQPDLLVFLDIDAAKAARRGGFGEERYETDDMQRAVRQTFYQLLERIDIPMVRIDASRNVESVAEDAWRSVHETLTDLRESGGMKSDLTQLKPLQGKD